MGWSGGTYTKGNNGTGGWVGDASLGIGIEAGRHDTQDNDFATGINQCLNKDGSNAATGNLNLGGFIPTNLAAGTAAAPAICAGNDINTGIFSAAADQIGIATNGVERVRLNASGTVDVKTTSTLEVAQLSRYSADANQAIQVFRKSRSASLDGNTIVQSGDALGGIAFAGANGTGYDYAASIAAEVDGTPGASSDMPGRLVFRTTADGSASTTERMRIDSAGCVGIGSASSTDTRLLINGTNTNNSTYALTLRNSASTVLFYARNDGLIVTGTLAASPYNNILGVAANVYVGTDGQLYRATSSIKYKTEIENYDKGLSELLSLRSVYYKDKKAPIVQYAGLIAEEVLEAGMPEFVQFAADNTPDGLNYGHMIALSVNAIKELNAKVDALEARVAELEP